MRLGSFDVSVGVDIMYMMYMMYNYRMFIVIYVFKHIYHTSRMNICGCMRLFCNRPTGDDDKLKPEPHADYSRFLPASAACVMFNVLLYLSIAV